MPNGSLLRVRVPPRQPFELIMKSGKQRKAEIKAARLRRATKGALVCDVSKLAGQGRDGLPWLARHGYYTDHVFRCKDCGAEAIWPAARQKWWYEVAKSLFTII